MFLFFDSTDLSYCADETLVTMLGLLEKMIAGDFVMGDKMTIADLYSYGVFSLCQETDGVDETVIDKFPKFKAVCNRVAAHPKVAEWLSKN